MPGIEGIDEFITIELYQADLVKIDIAIAITSISSMVDKIMNSSKRSFPRFLRGGAVSMKWKKSNPDNKKAGSIIQSMAQRCCIAKLNGEDK